MTTKDFIQKHYGIAGGVRTINSVMIDTKGNAYSYGYHYPLLFRVNGLLCSGCGANIDFIEVGYPRTCNDCMTTDDTNIEQ